MSKQGSGSKSKTASGKDKQASASSGGKKVPAAVKVSGFTVFYRVSHSVY